MEGINISDGERRLEETRGWSTSQKLHIAVFSDIHIPGNDDSEELQQIRQNFSRILAHAMDTGPDLLIISGDLGQDDHCLQSYSWTKTVLDQSNVPYLIIPGNHDQNDLIEKVFTPFRLSHGKLYYYVRFGCWNFVFLDSSPDSVSADQLHWLNALLDKAPAQSLWTLVMHHPPTKCGCRYMDENYPLMNSGAVLEIIGRHPQIKHVFSGHYHIGQDFMLSAKTKLHLTPSTWFQIDDQAPEFLISDPRIGYRRIVITGDELDTELIMLPIA